MMFGCCGRSGTVPFFDNLIVSIEYLTLQCDDVLALQTTNMNSEHHMQVQICGDRPERVHNHNENVCTFGLS